MTLSNIILYGIATGFALSLLAWAFGFIFRFFTYMFFSFFSVVGHGAESESVL